MRTKSSSTRRLSPIVSNVSHKARALFLSGALVGFTSLGGIISAPAVKADVPCTSGDLINALTPISGMGQSGTITLSAGCTYTMTSGPFSADGPNAFPDILGSVTIIGNGATITRSSTDDFRFFIVDDGGSLDISNVTLANGFLSSTEAHGGGAIINRSSLTVSGVTFSNNDSEASTGGGAIDNHDNGVLNVTNSTFVGNKAPQGGAIEDEGTLCHTTTPDCGHATIANSTFSGNSATRFGGGAFEGQLDLPPLAPSPPVCGPTWPQASCQEVGGAHDTLIADTFSGNAAPGTDANTGEGGAIATFGTMTLTNSTVTGNSAGPAGGGGVQNTGTLTITASTIAGNTSPFGSNLHSITTDAVHVPGATAISMSIVSAGSATNCSVSGTGSITDGGYNIDSGTSCGFSSAKHSQSSTDPLLNSLASNGGPTQTMSLQNGSPATGAGPGPCAVSTDQRGAPRGNPCDVGAFEIYTTPPTIPTLSAIATRPTEVDLSWSGSTDPLGVAGYDLVRDGSPLATVSGSTLSYADTTVAIGSTHSYQIDAFDGAGNKSQLSTAVQVTTPNVVYYFNWFDLASPGMKADNIHLLNTSGTTANVVVSMPGATPISVSVPNGTQTYVSFGHGHIGGPVVVSSDQVIRATQRVEYNSTFNEVNAESTDQAATTSYINWYDKASAGMYNDNIHLLNPGGTTANVTVSLPGFGSQPASVSPGGEAFVNFPAGAIGGPVSIISDQPILASQRVQYYGSFNEVWAEGAGRAATTSYVNWYDKATAGMRNDNIHLLNPGATSSDVTVSVPGATDQHVTVGAGAESYVTFPAGTIGGPVTINATQPVLASSRVQYYSTFNEVWSESASQAAMSKYVIWYDKASAGMYNDNIHLLNPGGTTANVTVTITGATTQMVAVGAGGETYVTFPAGTIGGPVTISSDQPILASQRIQYYASFNENWAS